MKKVGIITYHSAHNYGSVLQAYAMQQKIMDLGYDNQIIDYRMKEQSYYYRLYRTRFGFKALVIDLSQIPIHRLRKQRWLKFEQFIREKLMLSSVCKSPDEVYLMWDRYPLIISGSDQIWNKHSEELERNSWRYMMPYLLRGYKGLKISYASSIANMNLGEIERIKPYLLKFDSIAMRETSSVDLLNRITCKTISWTIDPTFLIDCEEWTKKLELKETDEKYILFYSLGGPRFLYRNIDSLKKIGEKKNTKVFIVTPFAYLPIRNNMIKNLGNVGPIEFLQLIKNARMVITDSYHGTILSVNFNREVYSLCESGGSHFRKTDILNKLSLGNRIVNSVSEILERTDDTIDYERVNTLLGQYRKFSISYLKKCLSYLNVI